MSTSVERFFAPVGKNEHFSLDSIQKKKSAVVILPSDAKYGGVSVRPVFMAPFDGEIDAVDPDDAWRQRKIAWVWVNFDGSYWIDTLSLTEKEAADWCSNRDRNEALGMKLIPVKFSLEP